MSADQPPSDDPPRRQATGDAPSPSAGHRALLRVWVEPATCIGSGNCVRLARGAFALNAEGVAEVVDPGALDEDRLRRAERSCPTGAIQIESR